MPAETNKDFRKMPSSVEPTLHSGAAAEIVHVGDVLLGIWNPVGFRLKTIRPPLPIFCEILVVILPG